MGSTSHNRKTQYSMIDKMINIIITDRPVGASAVRVRKKIRMILDGGVYRFDSCGDG